MNLFKFLIPFAVFFFLSDVSFGQRVISADLTYRCLGGETYEFTLTTYRDCSTISALPNSYFINVFSQTCGILGQQFRVFLNSKKEVSAACPTKKSYCKGGDQPGFEKFVFKGTYVLSKQCTDWQFNWLECPRPSSISNIQSPDSSCINTRAILNNKDASCVTSPFFGAELTGFVCKDGANTLNLGVQPTGDSLAFTSITPYRSVDPANGNPILVKYASGYNLTKPISTNQPFTVNNKTGDINFTPSLANEKNIIVVKVDQYRNRKLISSVMKDQQIFVYDCVLPTLTFSGFPTNVCTKKEIIINMGALDGAGNKTTLSWDNGIPSGLFSVTGAAMGTYSKNQTAFFKWKPQNYDAGLKTFVVKVKNDACPIYGEKSYTFSFNVIPTVDIQLRDDTLVPCGQRFPIKVRYSGGALPYSSKSWNTGETTDSIYKAAGKYIFTIRDNNNCTVSDSVTLNSGVEALFEITSSTCAGSPLIFRDLSTSVGVINSWNWKFGTNGSLGVQTVRNPTITINNDGIIPVSLTVRDNNGCVNEKLIDLAVCSIPEYSLVKRDTCVNKASIFYLASSKVCPIYYQNVNWSGGTTPISAQVFGGSNLNTISGIISNTYSYDPSNDTYIVSGTIGNSGNCTSQKTISIKVYPKPVFVSPFSDTLIYFNCNIPTITLSGLASTLIQGALPPLRYSWSAGAVPIVSNTIEPNLATVNDTLRYTVSAIDQRGCVDSKAFNIRYPIFPIIDIIGRCVESDTFKFEDISTINGTLESRTWDFGDGTPPRIDKKLYHIFPNETAYSVKLTIKDVSGCQLTKSQTILNSVPKSKMVNFSTCFGTNITLTSPSSDAISGILDRLVWKIKNRNLLDSTWYNKDSTILRNPEDLPSFNPNIDFFVPGKNNIYAYTTYNFTCRTTFKNTFFIYNNIKDSIFVKTQTCYNPDSVMHFRAIKQVSDNPIITRTWQFVDPVNNVSFKPKSINYSEDIFAKYDTAIAVNSSRIDTSNVTTLRIKLTTIDNMGCSNTNFSYFRNEILSQNDFELRGRCVNDDSTGVFIKNLNPINVGGAILFDLNKWEIGTDTVIRGFATGVFHKFKNGGPNTVILTCYNLDSTCKISTKKVLNILPLPKVEFSARAVCENDTTSLINLSIPASPGDSIIKYKWSLDNGLITSSSKNFKFKYPSRGTYTVGLYALNSTLCKDSITRQVTVLPKPTANFIISTDANEQQSNKPIEFTDQTTFADNIVKWKWMFTNRDSAVYTQATNTSFNYDSVGIYKVSQIVTNNVGCKDTINQRLDLNEYLILPTAFSPNSDTQNDELYLLYKGYKTLKEFKIYNRFGEKVFDAAGNLNARWDGTQNGLPSPVGSYVYYVTATSIYGKDKSFTGQLTLLR